MKTVLIGFGDIAPKHLDVLKELNCNIAGIVTRRYHTGIIKAKEFGIDKVYRSIDEISDNECDFFTVLVTPENNHQILKQIIPFKKPILIEKPITFSSKELLVIIELNKKFRTPIMIAMNRRFYSVFHKGLDYLKSKKTKLDAVVIEAPERFSDINLPKFSQVVRKNWMFSNSIHCVDLIRFFGGDIEKIETNSFPTKHVYSAIGHCKKDVEFTYISNWKSPGRWSVNLYAKDIRIIFNPLEKGVILENHQQKELTPSSEDIRFKTGFYLQLKFFL
ncbi:MAG: Gfo/Idh/MocA family oxidoreductase, partial [Thaumarchaeota archaeon]